MYEEEAKARQRLSKGRGQKGTEKVPEVNGEAREQAAQHFQTNTHYVSDATERQAVTPAQA